MAASEKCHWMTFLNEKELSKWTPKFLAQGANVYLPSLFNNLKSVTAAYYLEWPMRMGSFTIHTNFFNLLNKVEREESTCFENSENGKLTSFSLAHRLS